MIGVLALQGAFLEHCAKLKRLGVATCEVRKPEQLAACDGLIIPGGESTAITLVAQRTGMWDALKAFAHAGRPIWGTCAGAILLASHITTGQTVSLLPLFNYDSGSSDGGALYQPGLGAMDITVFRNFFGSQVASFEAELELAPALMPAAGSPRDASVADAAAVPSASAAALPLAPAHLTGVFIRAPAITRCGAGVTPLAWVTHRRGDAHNPSAAVDEVARVAVAARQGAFLATVFHPELHSTLYWHRLFVRMVEAATGRVLLSHESAAGGDGASAAAVPHGAMASPCMPPGTTCTPGSSMASSFRFAGLPVASTDGHAIVTVPVDDAVSGSGTATAGNAASFSIGHKVLLFPDTHI